VSIGVADADFVHTVEGYPLGHDYGIAGEAAFRVFEVVDFDEEAAALGLESVGREAGLVFADAGEGLHHQLGAIEHADDEAEVILFGDLDGFLQAHALDPECK
jgi:hypothetical protein